MKSELLGLLDRCRESFPGFTAIHFSSDPAAPVRVLTKVRIHNFTGLDHLQAWAYHQEAELPRTPEITVEPLPGMTRSKAIDLVVEHVAAAFGVDVPSIHSQLRTADVARARQVCMVLSRELLSLSSSAVGAAFNRDHGTILNATKAVADACATEPKTRKLVEDLRGVLKNELEHITQ